MSFHNNVSQQLEENNTNPEEEKEFHSKLLKCKNLEEMKKYLRPRNENHKPKQLFRQEYDENGKCTKIFFTEETFNKDNIDPNNPPENLRWRELTPQEKKQIGNGKIYELSICDLSEEEQENSPPPGWLSDLPPTEEEKKAYIQELEDKLRKLDTHDPPLSPTFLINTRELYENLIKIAKDENIYDDNNNEDDNDIDDTTSTDDYYSQLPRMTYPNNVNK